MNTLTTPHLPQTPPPSLQTNQHIAIVVHDGMDHGRYVRTLRQLAHRGQSQIYVLGHRLGSVRCADGQRIEVDATLRRWPGAFFDVVYVMHAPDGRRELLEEVFISAAACRGATVIDVSAPQVRASRLTPVLAAARPDRFMARLENLARMLAPGLARV